MEAHQYNGFNLILVDLSSKSMVYVSNRPKDNEALVSEVPPGIHVLSTASLDTPWPKVRKYLALVDFALSLICVFHVQVDYKFKFESRSR